MVDGARYTALLAAAEVALAASGRAGRLAATELLQSVGQSTVLRCTRQDPRGRAPETVIVKQFLAPKSSTEALARFSREKTALELLDEREPGLCPRVFASDSAARVLVLEDIQDSLSLWDVLSLRDRTHATAGYVEAAAAFGRLHAVTREPPASGVRRDAPEDLIRALVSMPIAHADAVATWAFNAVENPVMGTVLCHLDATPRNYLIASNSRGRLIDFELAARGHPFLDAVQFLYGFAVPARMLPADVREQAESAYFQALGSPWDGAREELLAAMTYVALAGLLFGVRNGRFMGWEYTAFAELEAQAKRNRASQTLEFAKSCRETLAAEGCAAVSATYPAFRDPQ